METQASGGTRRSERENEEEQAPKVRGGRSKDAWDKTFSTAQGEVKRLTRAWQERNSETGPYIVWLNVRKTQDVEIDVHIYFLN